MRKAELYTLDFPALSYHELEDATPLISLLDQHVLEAYESPLAYLVLLGSEAEVAQVKVNLPALTVLPKRGLIVTARAQDADFYSRCFYPKCHVPEDPVTGSAHCVLTPFWSERLGKKRMKAIQGATRKGEIRCQWEGERVYLSGQCRWYLKGYLQL
jgi:predicted PhzF superfamily epimerase YddE/YHI9